MKYFLKSTAILALIAACTFAFPGCSSSSGVDDPDSTTEVATQPGTTQPATTTPAGQTNSSYTITFDGDSATTAPTPATMTITAPATTVGLLPANPEKTGYDFAGWWTEKNGAGSAFTVTTTVGASMTVYAKWTAVTIPPPESCVIQFNANGGTGTMASQTMPVASPVALTAKTFARYQHDFLGWATSDTGAVAYADGAIPTVQAGTLTLYAVWLSHCEPVSNLTYSVTDGKAVITSINTTSTNVVIPETIGGYPVVFSGNETTGLFEGNTTVQSVTIPPSMTTIPAKTFKNSSVTSVTIPNTVKTIGDEAFYRCEHLASIDIPDSVTTIGAYAFTYCSNLTSINFPDSVTTIGGCAFAYCSSLTSIDIPNTVTSIGDQLLCYCSSLTSVSLPDTMKTIPMYMFYYCTKLASISLPKSLTLIKENAFGYTGLTTIIIPDSVTRIEDWTFGYCDQLTSITLPQSITSVGPCAFMSGNALTKIIMRSTTPPSFSILFPSSIATIMVPSSTNHVIRDAYRTSPKWLNYASIIVDE